MHNPSTGLHWVLAALFMVTDMSIGGQVALPAAIFRSQFVPGLVLLALFALLTTWSAVLLGQCWHILLQRFPKYQHSHCRKPYAEIGGSWGSGMKSLVSLCLNLTQFGSCTVFLLLCAGNTRDFLRPLLPLNSSLVDVCLPLILFALLLLPITLLKSPNDFWPILFGGMFCTGSTFVLICVGTFLDWYRLSVAAVPSQHDNMPNFNFNNYLDAIGTILFAYGGHTAIPTIQHDMKDPAEFSKSAFLGFSMISLFNFAVVLLSCWVYGNSLGDSVVASIQTVWIRQLAMVLITANSLLAIVLIINPVNQEIEELFGVPQKFGWGRFLVRSGVLASVLFVAESVPNFGPILNFVGASTITFTSLIFPFLFHLLLFSDGYSTIRRILAFLVFGFVSVAGVLATWSALKALVGVHFAVPCYLRNFLNQHNRSLLSDAKFA